MISVNFMHPKIKSDYVYMSNLRRHHFWKENEEYKKCKKIIVSNIYGEAGSEDEWIISFNRLIKCGWQHLDNSTIMLLRLLDLCDVNSIGIAGFDGYDLSADKNYAMGALELENVKKNPGKLNEEISSMLLDYKETRKKQTPISFVTESRFSKIFSD